MGRNSVDDDAYEMNHYPTGNSGKQIVVKHRATGAVVVCAWDDSMLELLLEARASGEAYGRRVGAEEARERMRIALGLE